MGRGALNLHGHSHGRLAPMPRQYDVGVYAMEFTPVTVDGILTSRCARRIAKSSAEKSGT